MQTPPLLQARFSPRLWSRSNFVACRRAKTADLVEGLGSFDRRKLRLADLLAQFSVTAFLLCLFAVICGELVVEHFHDAVHQYACAWIP